MNVHTINFGYLQPTAFIGVYTITAGTVNLPPLTPAEMLRHPELEPLFVSRAGGYCGA